jgi:methyl-accepting chemotaxis protein
MPKLNFRIGTKLGITSGLGILLVAGMLLSQQLGNGSVMTANDLAAGQTTIAYEAQATASGIRTAQTAVREIRLATSPAEINSGVEAVRAALADVDKHLDTAIGKTVKPENRERLQKIKPLAKEYGAAAEQLAEAQRQIHANLAKRWEITVEWTKAFEALMASSALTRLANRTEIDAGLRDANADFHATRAAAFRFALNHEDNQKKLIADLAEKNARALARLQGNVGDKALADDIAKLAAASSSLKAAADEAAKLEEAKAHLVRERLLKAATAATTIMAEAITVANRTAAERGEEARAALSQASYVGLGVGALVILVLIASAAFGMLSIARPIARIGATLLELANGNKGIDIPFTARGDEVGDAARAAATFRDNLVRMEKIEAEQREAELRAAAEKRAAEEREAAQQKAAEEKAAADRKAAMHKLADEFERAVGNIINTVSSASTELEAAATTLTNTADTTQKLSTVVASASEEASSNVQSVASATEEMTGSVGEISRQVQESSTIANEAVNQARKTDARINDLSQAASRIGDVVKLITAIAEQTNLLALNATIEAARAGEAGKGFAVVAQEVKALAAQTAKATGEIGTQIAGMQMSTQDSVVAIKEIGSTIDRISHIAATIAAAVEEQGAATQEIARNVQEAAKGTAEVASNIVNVNHGAAETGSASSQVLASAKSLSSESNHLKVEVNKFLQTVRAA